MIKSFSVRNRFNSAFLAVCFLFHLVLSGLPLVCENIGPSQAGSPVYPDGISMDLPFDGQHYPPARAAILADTESGEILYARNIDEKIPPASLTKLVTIALGMEYMKQEGIRDDQTVKISPASWAVHAPPRSSLMFLGPEQDPTWKDLLLGLAVDSGNDAAIALAEAVSGTVPAFVESMNELARRLGLKDTHFKEPSGYSELNITSARDYCTFLVWYLKNFPDNLKKLHSIASFQYPYREGVKHILQYNRNRLVRDYPGADGLKTGYIDESGFNLAFTARREGLRLVGLILGGVGDDSRNREAEYLLDQGFALWEERWVEIPGQGPIRTFNADKGQALTQAKTVRLILPKTSWTNVFWEKKIPQAIQAPWPADVPAGESVLSGSSGKVLVRIPVYFARGIAEGNPVQAFGEGIYLWAEKMLGGSPPVTLAAITAQGGQSPVKM